MMMMMMMISSLWAGIVFVLVPALLFVKSIPKGRWPRESKLLGPNALLAEEIRPYYDWRTMMTNQVREATHERG
jgi:hypothetical protein